MLEAGLGELALVAVAQHAVDEVGLELADTPPVRLKVAMERRSWSAAGREAGADDGDLDRLFLEQRHAVGLQPLYKLDGGWTAGRGPPIAREAIRPAAVAIYCCSINNAGTHKMIRTVPNRTP